MEIRELITVAEMAAQLETMHELYPNMTLEKYQSYLEEMVPRDYKQVAVFENEICLGLTGYWYGTKLWSGKYIEIDNFVVRTQSRSRGIGKMICDYIDQKAKDLNCSMIVLDAFTGNFPAHRFYYNQGFGPKGFHFVKILDENGLT
ncbi:GNAT family N-acetyltransferase [Flavobacterium terrisoli]|uniref:GNAT family N-acetyltransferase n=1 Tax=Flavobacterium terrisoli TaxID=3242195 RepID=UPI002542E4F2|nr:GNAT family N-acetyltransferase [Flavobacterium buctense]